MARRIGSFRTFVFFGSLCLQLFSLQTFSAGPHFQKVATNAWSHITQYRVMATNCMDRFGKEQIQLRTFQRLDQKFSVIVDPQTLETQIVLTRELKCSKVFQSFASDSSHLISSGAHSKYENLLIESARSPFPLENDGLIHSMNGSRGWLITMDLCPSHRPLTRQFFQALEGQRGHETIPIAITVSGLWLDHHQEDLSWLKDQVDQNRFHITWVNHSNKHPYVPGLPYKDNFLLMKGVDFNDEILTAEIKMIESGLVPSVFFRFPGLVSSQKLITSLARDYGLIALGADAWLAKGEAPKKGSLILIHGNGNEPAGLSKFLNIISKFPHAELGEILSFF